MANIEIQTDNDYKTYSNIEIQTDNDPLLSWINENYDITKNENDIIKVKDIQKLFTNSPFYNSLGRKMKLEYNYVKFLKLIKTNWKLRTLYYDRKKINQKDFRNLLIGIKNKPLIIDLNV